MRPLVILAALLISPLLAAPVPKAPKVKDDEVIVGVWKVEALDTGGGKFLDPDQIAKTRFYFDEKGRYFFDTPTPLALGGKFKIDPTAKAKTFEFAFDDQTLRGLYELDGETLKLCWNQTDGSLPTEFKADGKGVLVWTLKRAKDEKNVLKKDE